MNLSFQEKGLDPIAEGWGKAEVTKNINDLHNVDVVKETLDVK